ncbi:hypothetical protein HAALTHF_30660n [Vreelandella aquamarina]|nr:hypothetical protein HAALTHF_30660n [Halomonas axialensis]
MNTPAADQRLAAFQEIPIIDIHPLLHGDEQARREVAAELGRAARDVGFSKWWAMVLMVHCGKV